MLTIVMLIWRPVKGSVALHERAQVLFQRQKEGHGYLRKRVMYTDTNTYSHMYTYTCAYTHMHARKH